jgi:hypothetical protein
VEYTSCISSSWFDSVMIESNSDEWSYENQVFEGLRSKIEIVVTNREKTEEMVSFKLHFHFLINF